MLPKVSATMPKPPPASRIDSMACVHARCGKEETVPRREGAQGGAGRVETDKETRRRGERAGGGAGRHRRELPEKKDERRKREGGGRRRKKRGKIEDGDNSHVSTTIMK